MMKLGFLVVFQYTFSVALCQNWSIQNSFTGTPIDDGIGFSIEDRGYVGSGRDIGFQYSNNFYKFENNQWEQIASLNGLPRQYATSFNFSGTGCIVTGLAPQDSLLNEIQCYSETNDEWHIKSPFPGRRRLQAASFSVGEYGFCGGGRDLQGNFKDWYEFDFLANSWARIADFPDVRYECVAFSINGIGYVGLGTDGQGIFYKDVYSYNPLTDQWNSIPPFPGNNAVYAIAFGLSNKGYICTGLDDFNSLTSEFWSYDPAENNWVQLSDFSYPKIKGVSNFTIDYCSYIVTGIDENSMRQNVTYSFCEESNTENDILIYPNPASNAVVIILEEEGGGNLKMYNLIGEQVFNDTFLENYNVIKIDFLPKGAYVISITTSEQKYIRKIILK